MGIESITVIGAGTMSRGIAQVAAQAGFEVVLEDINEEIVAPGMARIRDNLKKGVQRGKLSEEEARTALARVKTSTSIGEAAGDADLIVEAIVEKLDARQQLMP